MELPTEGDGSAAGAPDDGVPIHTRLKERAVATRTSRALTMIVLVALIGLALTGIGFFSTALLRPIAGVQSVVVNTVQAPVEFIRGAFAGGQTAFDCDDGDAFTARFSAQAARLTLSDGRELTVPEISPGVFANPDRSFVLDASGTKASIVEEGRRTYRDCVAR